LETRATIRELTPQNNILTQAMTYDLQQIYLTWVKDTWNNWLEVLPSPTNRSSLYGEQPKELELDEHTVEEERNSSNSSANEQISFSTLLELLKITASMLKVQLML
jgi:hypothetical protein